eukprot:4745680-Pyramimonas_sp.AAC.1
MGVDEAFLEVLACREVAGAAGATERMVCCAPAWPCIGAACAAGLWFARRIEALFAMLKARRWRQGRPRAFSLQLRAIA